DEEPAVVAVVGRPPGLRCRHQLEEVPLQRLDVEGLELLGVVEVLAHRVGPGRVLVEDLQVHLIGPPVTVRPGPVRLGSGSLDDWVLALAAGVRHVRSSWGRWLCHRLMSALVASLYRPPAWRSVP